MAATAGTVMPVPSESGCAWRRETLFTPAFLDAGADVGSPQLDGVWGGGGVSAGAVEVCGVAAGCAICAAVPGLVWSDSTNAWRRE